MKKLSPNMVKVLLAADIDGWIRKSDAPVSTAVALMERELIGVLRVVSRGDGSGYVRQGHYLTGAGKAKVAELRGETAQQPAADAPEIRAGDLIEIRQSGKRKWAMRVERYMIRGWQGTQIRMIDGKPGRVRFAPDLKSGEYTIIERAKPAATVAAEQPRSARVTATVADTKDVHTEHCCKLHGCKYRDETCTVTSGEKRQSFPCEHCAETVADDDNVPVLSTAQIDALHWIGAPLSTAGREKYMRRGGSECPASRTVAVLVRYGYAEISPWRLTDAGRAAYLAHKPTGRLSKPFGDAWRTATQRTGTEADQWQKRVAADAAMIRAGIEFTESTETKPELPTLDELVSQISRYAERYRQYRSGMSTANRPAAKLAEIRKILATLYGEAGR